MSRSIPAALGDSRQFRPLRQFARCVAELLWRTGEVQRWANESALLAEFQRDGYFVDEPGPSEFPDVLAQLKATGFLVSEGESLLLPILSADAARPSKVKRKRRKAAASGSGSKARGG